MIAGKQCTGRDQSMQSGRDRRQFEIEFLRSTAAKLRKVAADVPEAADRLYAMAAEMDDQAIEMERPDD